MRTKSKLRLIVLLVVTLGVVAGWLGAQTQQNPLAPVPYLEIERGGCLYEDTFCIPGEDGGQLCLFSRSSLCWERAAMSSDAGCGEWTGWVEASSTVVLRSRECSPKGQRIIQWQPWPYSLLSSEELVPLTSTAMAAIRQVKRPLGQGLFWLEIPLPPGLSCGEWGPWIEIRPGLKIRSQRCVDQESGSRFVRWEAMGK